MEIHEYVLNFIRNNPFKYTFIELKHRIPHYKDNVSTHDALCDLFNSDVLGTTDDFKVFVSVDYLGDHDVHYEHLLRALFRTSPHKFAARRPSPIPGAVM